MKSNVSKASKSSKRTQALKNMLDSKSHEEIDQTHLTISLEDIRDDLIEGTAEQSDQFNISRKITFDTEQVKQEKSNGSETTQSIVKSIGLFNRLIDKEIVKTASAQDIDEEELKAWIDLQIEAPAKSLLHLLRTANRLGLDPLQEEILLTRYGETWQVLISVDGWIKLINRHPYFAGVTFTESTEFKDGLPIWMECTIYRSDMVIPTTAREYLSEVINDTEIWSKMPRRLLRHRALQQCARIVMGYKPPEIQ